MRHRIQSKMRIGATQKNASRRKALWRQAFADDQNDSKRLLDYPVLEIEDTNTCEEQKTKKRDQLVPPFHVAM